MLIRSGNCSVPTTLSSFQLGSFLSKGMPELLEMTYEEARENIVVPDHSRTNAEWYRYHLVPLVQHLLEEYEKQGVLPPKMSRDQIQLGEAKFNDQVFDRLSVSAQVFTEIQPDPDHETWQNRSCVEFFLIGGETMVFRSQHDNELHVLRKTYASSWLNQKLKLDTVPRARFASVNGRFGLLSDFARGDLPTHTGKTVGFSSEEIDPYHLCDVMAFEFLIGNTDVHNGNYHIDSDGRIRVFDHESAFVPGVHYHAWKRIGHELPFHYNPSFLSALLSLSPEDLKEDLGVFLLPYELEGVLFRRDVILLDAISHHFFVA